MRSREQLRLGAPITFVGRPDAGEREQGTVLAKRKPDHVLFLGDGIRLRRVFGKLEAGTRQRLSGFSHPRQWGEDVFRMFVTGAPPNLGGGGMPQRILISSRPSL